MPLKIIGAGFGRTGTMSLKHALEVLEYGPCYHMIELTNEPENVKFWEKAARQKQVNWDELFEAYHSVADFPGCLFYKELMDAYPDAKVILTVRDEEAWYESARKTIFKSYPTWRQLVRISLGYLFNKRIRLLMRVGWIINKLIFHRTFRFRMNNAEKAIAAYRLHNREVMEYVPEEKLLVYDVSQGWEPLCKFLEVPVPDVPFPNTNRSDHFHKMKNATLRGPVSEEMKKQ